MQKGVAYWMDLKSFNEDDPFFLAQIQKGISNFIKILIGQDIPVTYAINGESMTDGKFVYIAAHLTKDNLDYAVGLALHEASHILLTDFDFLKKNNTTILKYRYGVEEKDLDNVSTLINFIEDKRIDNYVYTTAPGYQFYYEELYRKSFYNKIVDNNLQNGVFKTPTWDSYLFRIINIFNKNSDLEALPSLKEVYDTIDISNISRLKTTIDSVVVAVKIYNLIKDHLVEDKDIINPVEDRIKKHTEKQKKFINSEYKKKRVTKKFKGEIDKLADSSTSLKYCPINVNTSMPVVVTTKWEGYFGSRKNSLDYYVTKGLVLGKKLLNQLSISNSIKNEIFENQNRGKLNSKKLFQANYNENLFYRVEKEKSKNIFIHISLDLSGSMQGKKLHQTIQTAVAIAYAACNLPNLDVEISFRGTTGGSKSTPLLAYAFDSRKHNASYLKKFNYIQTCGFTPEGICLSEIQNTLPLPGYYQDTYLMNISDGLPNINSPLYGLKTAVEHTKKVINNYTSKGIGVMSYYIKDTWDNNNSKDTFEIMYGKNSQFIDVNDIHLVAKSINNLLLTNTIKFF